jgi:hypothetical protein
MANEILTGNSLSDGITYHASDINAAVNNATILPGLIEDKAVTTADVNYKLLASDGTSLVSTTIQSVKNTCSSNIIATGILGVVNTISYYGTGSFNVSGTLNNYGGALFSQVTQVWFSGTATITGLVAPAFSGVLKVITCLSGAITLNRLDANSSAGNRMNWGTAVPSFTLAPAQSATFMYTTVNNTWQLLCTNRTP